MAPSSTSSSSTALTPAQPRFAKSREELKHYQKLVEQEKQEEFRQYQEKILRKPLQERVKQGYTWYPVEVEKVSYLRGENIVLHLVKTKEPKKRHGFQSGQVVAVFSNREHTEQKENPMEQGVIARVQGKRMQVVLGTGKFPKFLEAGHIGVDLYFDETTYKEMDRALRVFRDAENNRTATLRELLFGYGQAEQPEHYPSHARPHLNASQNQALSYALAAPDAAVIHGPPGTGKTTALVAAIGQCLQEEQQVLVCAPSNTAVDVLSERLAAGGHRVLRLGHPVRVSEQLQNLTLDAQFEEHEQYPIMQRLRREAQEKLHRATKQRRSYRSKQERAQDFKEMGKMKNQARELEQQILDDVVREAQVICCTPVGSTQQVLDNLRFKTVFMDEAAQSMTPASLIPLCKAERVIFAGDHCQLPPTVKSREAGQQGLDESLFEKFYRRQLGQFGLRAGRMLQTQYRMHEAIMAFSNAWFYNGELMADESVRTHTLLPPGTDERASQPFELIDTSGCGYEEQQNPETLSRYNTGEARLLLKRVAGLLADLSDYVDTTYTVGILAPYRAQVATLDELFENEFPLALTKQHRIEIDTIDAFQGQERDIIAIGLTRSNAKAQIGFLSDRRRMNVALTRARQKLILAGDATTVTSDNFFQALFDHAEATGAYLHAWELPEVTAEV